MATSVALKLTNRGANYKEATNNIPVNGRQQTIAAAFSGFFPDGKVVVNVVEVTQPGNAGGITIRTGPADGPYKDVKTDGTPLSFSSDGSAIDVSNWVIVAGR